MRPNQKPAVLPGMDAMAPLGVSNTYVKPAQQLLQAATHWAQDESDQRVLRKLNALSVMEKLPAFKASINSTLA